MSILLSCIHQLLPACRARNIRKETTAGGTVFDRVREAWVCVYFTFTLSSLEFRPMHKVEMQYVEAMVEALGSIILILPQSYGTY